MIAYGKLPKDAMAMGFSEGKLGFEFSGLAPVPAGAPPRRVMGIAKQAIATRVDAPPYLVCARLGPFRGFIASHTGEVRAVHQRPHACKCFMLIHGAM